MRRTKRKEHENLTGTNIRKVIRLLNSEDPITKKEACDILNITYNTTRLNKIIEEYQEEAAFRKKKVNEKRGTLPSTFEIATIAEAYMEGDSLSDISKRIYRSVNFVKNVINKVGVPRRVTLEEAANIEYLPEECVSEDFVAGEIAWSAKYHTSCEVMAKLEDSKYYDKYNTHCYKIWLREHSELRDSGGFFAYVPGYDLGKLSHLEEYGVNVKSI